MIYNKFQGLELPALGFGAMRLPITDGKLDQVDQKLLEEMVAYAMSKGVNYFDTAWEYHDGRSEFALGEALERYPRESYYLADKFPGYNLANMDKVEEIFEAQLERCRTDYFDFYLFHNVCEMNIDEYLDPKFGIYDYLMEQKKKGRIRHLGFSAHGTLETMERFLDAYGSDMEFCQIQLNWLDWKFQNAKGKVELLKAHDIPIWVMEPVRGGSLVKLLPEDEEKLRALEPEWTMAEWAFRFIQSIPGMIVTLSGMSDFEQLKENIGTFAQEVSLSEEKMAVLFEIAEKMTAQGTVPCTACQYCTAHCPQELDIPWLLELYNEKMFTGGDDFIASMGLDALEAEKKPEACIGCGACEAVCPQQIKIAETLADFAEKMKK